MSISGEKLTTPQTSFFKIKKRIIKTTIILIGLSFLIGATHYFVLPAQTRCHLINFYNFEKDGNIYYRKETDAKKIKQLKEIIKKAEIRVSDFWGTITTDPVYIYCDNEKDYQLFGTPFGTPACAHMEIASYVVINKTGIHLDVVAHELNHTELYERIGHINRELKIPVWFDEGLAMQVDYRAIYSTGTLRQKTNDFATLPDVKQLNSYAAFGGGSYEETLINYAAAKYEVGNWHTEGRLNNFIKNINAGLSFEKAYRK